ncbi:MAG: GTP-binding protein, partial [Gemmatimonadota bacterium]
MASASGSEAIRNVVLLGHGGSGKTTLADAMTYIAGASSRRGSVTEGTAYTDFSPEEQEHGMSIELALARLPWMDARVNLLDTPGYQDFWGQTHA